MDTKMTVGPVQLQVNLPGWLLYIKKPSQTIGSDNWMVMSDEINASKSVNRACREGSFHFELTEFHNTREFLASSHTTHRTIQVFSG